MAQTTVARKTNWSKRLLRAEELADRYPSSREVLEFYRVILEFQQSIYTDVSARAAADLDPAVPFRQQLDLQIAVRWLPDLLSVVQDRGPHNLVLQAAELRQMSRDEQHELLRGFLFAPEAQRNHVNSFYSRVLFQPCAEHIGATAAAKLEGFSGSICPLCKSQPQLAVLRPEGEGGKKFLLCSLCLTEWEFRRILCPVCAEENYEQLPRYTAEDMAPVRVDACDTCKHYLKSVDMTIDGLAVPIVDEIATVPLDLWAVERGYSKPVPNLMGF